MTADGQGIDSNIFGISRVGTHRVLTPKEALTFENRKAFDSAVQKLTEENQVLIVLDCKAVPFLDSEALEKLVETHDELSAQGGSLKIVGLNAVCRDILIVTRLINLFHIYSDVPEAVRSRQ